jgi:type IV pilus assembly protein PilC
MPAYLYRAKDSGGQLVTGRADADSEREVVLRLRNQGLLVLGVERDRDLAVMVQTSGGFFARRFSGKELAIFARQFATMVNAGLPVVASLRVLSRQVSHPRLRYLLGQIASDVEAGEGLAAAFSRHGDAFPPVMIHMIHAGEVGGILDEVLLRLATQLEKEEAIRQKVNSALVYPAIVSVMAVGVVIFLMIFVVPRFVQVYADLGTDLPLPTQVLISASDLFQRAWWAVLGALAALLLAVRYARRVDQVAEGWDRLALKVPVFGPLRTKQSIGRFSRLLSGLLGSGITILKALAVVERTVSNRVVAAAVREALEGVRQGQGLAATLRRSGVFPPMVLELIAVGEETGTLEEMLGKVADFYEEEVQRTAERLSASLEPAVIVGLAVTVGFIVSSMMLPIFNLWSSIG